MATLGFGVIGLGRIGRLHADHLLGGVRGARLVAAAVSPEDRARLLGAGDAPCHLVADAAALVARRDVEAVLIASPASLHREHVALAVAADKPVFCEKPLADGLAPSREVAALVVQAGIPFQIGFQRRFDPAYVRARELVAAGAIGRPEMFRAITCDRIPPVDFLRTSGGLFWDLAIHDFDAARFLLADEVEAVFAAGAVQIEPRLAEFGDVDHGLATLRFQSGALGVCQAAWRAPAGYDIRAEVHGSLGKVVAEVDEQWPTRLYDARGLVSSRHDRFTERFKDAYLAELQAFVDALQRGTALSPNADDGLRAALIADAAVLSHRRSGWVTI